MNQDKVTTRGKKKGARIKCNEGKFKLKVYGVKVEAVAYECFLKTFSRFLRFNFRALYKDIKRFSATSNANIRFVRVVRPEKTRIVSVSSILMVFP